MTKKGATKKKVGRPRVEIDIEEVRKLAKMQCTNKEIAAWFGCSESTIERRYRNVEDFRDAIEEGRAFGRASMRRRMWHIAFDDASIEFTKDGEPILVCTDARMRGHATKMAIWLSKQYLGMTDKAETDSTVRAEPVVIEIPPNGRGPVDPKAQAE